MPDASAAASTSTSVLPSSTVPIIFSGRDSSQLTSFAATLPSSCKACMRAREAAVSDVSLALKKADSSDQQNNGEKTNG